MTGKGVVSTLWLWQYHARQRIAGLWCRYGSGPRDPTEIPKPHRVLIVIAGLIGDSVMSSPVIMEARRLWPDAKIALLGSPAACALFAACPHVDESHEARAVPFTIRQGRRIAEIEAWLRDRRFDIAIIVLGDQFASLLGRVRVPIRVGVKGSALEPCLTHAYDIGSARTWGPRERLRSLEVLGLLVRDTDPRLWVSPDVRTSVRERLRCLGVAVTEPYIVVHPFGSTQRQWWPFDRVAGLARFVAQRGYKAILVGGNETVRGGTDPALAGVDVRGLLGVEELLALIERASAVVTTDSGPYHVAGALGVRTLGLFRASRPEHADRYATATVLRGQDASCRGRCGWDECAWVPCRQMAALSQQQVERSLESLLSRATP